MPPKRKVELNSKDNSKLSTAKRVRDDSVTGEPAVQASNIDNVVSSEVVVDYGDVEQTEQIVDSVAEDASMEGLDSLNTSPDAAEKQRITKLLESWCRNNISIDNGDADAEDRVTALAEVGLLLVFEQTKYPNAESMRVELEDIGSIIGGDDVVKKYINFILSLQNQMKKAKYQAERQQARQQPHFHHHPQQFQQVPFGGFQAHMMMPQHHPYYQPQPFTQPGNMTLNATGELTAVQKQREKDRKRKEILGECTEHLKALLERVTRSSDPTEKATIYGLIDKVKKRIDSLKEIPQAQTQHNKPSGGQARGYFGNQYVNPNIADKQQ